LWLRKYLKRNFEKTNKATCLGSKDHKKGCLVNILLQTFQTIIGREGGGGGRLNQMTNRAITILLLCLYLGSCVTEGTGKTTLIKADKLSAEERLRWRAALEFPKHCRDGVYEWDDESHPRLGFLEIGHNRYIAYNMCDLSINQVNMFLIDMNTPEAKPRQLVFKTLVEIYDPKLDSGFYEGESTDKQNVQYAERVQENVKYKAYMTSLLAGSFFVNEQGQLVVDKRSNAKGTCGTYSLYNLDSEQPKLVGFRAQSSCHGSNDVRCWKSYPQDYIENLPLLEK
jgi:hypothetical protein